MYSLFNLIDIVLELYMWAVILMVVMSWLITFDVINTRNRLVYAINELLTNVTEPALRPIRRTMSSVLPNLGNIDLAPLVLLLGIYFMRSLLREYGPLGAPV